MDVRDLFTNLIIFLSFFIPDAIAERGMWFEHQLPDLEHLEDAREAGAIQIGNAELGELATAVAQLDVYRVGTNRNEKASSGTGFFVTRNGLFLTNHHVVDKCLGALRGQAPTIFTKGYTASSALASQAKHANTPELVCPNLRLTIVHHEEDVTEEMFVEEREEFARRKLIEEKKEPIEERCEKKFPSDKHNCIVKEYENGELFMLHVLEYLEDLRIVHVPPAVLVKLELGPTDVRGSWRAYFPTDYAFLRAYYDGQPYEPPAVIRLPANANRYANRDTHVIAVGFPGKTRRKLSATGLAFYMEEQVPLSMQFAAAKNAPGAVAWMERELNELIRLDILEQREEEDARIERGLLADLGLLDAMGNPFDALRELYERRREYEVFTESLEAFVKNDTVRPFFILAVFNKMALERQKPEDHRQTVFQDRNFPTLTKSIRGIYQRYLAQRKSVGAESNPSRVALNNLLQIYLKENRFPLSREVIEIPGTEVVFDNPVASFGKQHGLNTVEDIVEMVMDQSAFHDPGFFDKLVAAKGIPEELRDDPMVSLLLRLHHTMLAVGKHPELARAFKAEAPMRRNEIVTIRQIADGWSSLVPEYEGSDTRRFHFGRLAKYQVAPTMGEKQIVTNADLAYLATSGKRESATGKLLGSIVSVYKPFQSTKLDLRKWCPLFGANDERSLSKDEIISRMPRHFFADFDTTYGNSGGPTLNAHGELIAITEGARGRSFAVQFAYTDDYKTVSNDIRHIMCTAAVVGGATRILEEMQKLAREG